MTECAECGAKLDRPGYRTMRVKHSFCDRKCKGKWQSKLRKPADQYSNKYRVIKRNGKSVREHRHVLAEKLGRELLPTEDAHHKNCDPLDNRPDNLTAVAKTEHIATYHSHDVSIERIGDLRKQRFTINQIAQNFGVSKAFVRRRLKILNQDGSLPTVYKWDTDKAVAMLQQGVSRQQVAKTLGITTRTLGKFLEKKQIQTSDCRHKHFFDKRVVLEAYRQCKTIRKTAKQLNVPYGTLRKFMTRSEIN